MRNDIPGFIPARTTPAGVEIAYETAGAGPPLLLLHGFPQTRAMWAAVAPQLSKRFTVVVPDLRGYGESGKPQGTEAMSFRAMAADLVALMAGLGFDRFHVAGHDRGGRTAHRMALDHPNTLDSLTVMDIVPTHHLLGQLTFPVARAYYHWFFLAQPAPFPECVIGADPNAYYESCLLGFGAAQLSDFSQIAAYRAAWADPACRRAMCDDYRAALDVDFAHDAEDLGRRVEVPALVLFGAEGAMARAYDVPATWSDRLANMQSAALPGGHFFVDQHPTETAQALEQFLTGL